MYNNFEIYDVRYMDVHSRNIFCVWGGGGGRGGLIDSPNKIFKMYPTWVKFWRSYSWTKVVEREALDEGGKNFYGRPTEATILLDF